MTYLALDLETVLDVELVRRLHPEWVNPELDAEDDALNVRRLFLDDLRERTGKADPFPKPIYHRVVAVGMAYLSGSKADSTSLVSEDESELLGAVFKALSSYPTLVTYNGRGFDIPVLKQRAYALGMGCAVLYGGKGPKPWDQYDYRYNGPHLDVGDYLTTFGACAMPSMAELLAASHLPPKIGQGASVQQLWDDQEYAQIGDYVKRDAELTLKLALRLLKVRGSTEDDQPSLFEEPDDPEALAF